LQPQKENNMDPERRAYLDLHIAVLLFGFTAILGDVISLSALMLVWWRVLLTSVSLLALVRVGRLLRTLPLAVTLRFMGIGVIGALHWLAFYGAIKLANASIALVCMALTSFFTSLLEPLLMRTQIKRLQVAMGLLMAPGMAMIVNATELSMHNGIWAGIAAAFLAALFSTLNKKYIGHANPMEITFLELGAAWLFLSLVLPAYHFLSPEGLGRFLPTPADWGYLALLAFLCTTLAYVLALRALRRLSAFVSNLTINLEPVYGIALAWLLLGDHKQMSPVFYLGVVLILAVVFLYPLAERRRLERSRKAER
jgi:drug/metabolite transporter (DMT)-like permease